MCKDCILHRRLRDFHGNIPLKEIFIKKDANPKVKATLQGQAHNLYLGILGFVALLRTLLFIPSGTSDSFGQKPSKFKRKLRTFQNTKVPLKYSKILIYKHEILDYFGPFGPYT